MRDSLPIHAVNAKHERKAASAPPGRDTFGPPRSTAGSASPGTPQSTVAQPSSAIRLMLHVGFIFTGVVTTLLGPLLPFLAARWALSDDRAGMFFTAQFLGSLAGVFLTSFLLPRRGFAFTLSLSFALMAAGIIALGIGPWALGLASVALFGIGLGLNIPATNLWIAEAAPHRRAGALSILNFAWSLGAVSWPALAHFFLRSFGLRGLVTSLAACLGVLACAFILGASTSPRFSPSAAPTEAAPLRTWTHRTAFALGVLFFLYVGTETALGGWVASYAKRIPGEAGSIWLLTPSAFWGALLLGRVSSPLLLSVVTEARLMLMGLLFAAAGAIALLAARTIPGVVLGASLAGLGLASIFPILVAWLRHLLGASATRASGPMFALGSLGGAVVPWAVGIVSTRAGALQPGLAVPLIAMVVMIFLSQQKSIRAEIRAIVEKDLNHAT